MHPNYHEYIPKALIQEKKIRAIVRQEVAAALREVFSDPDRGLELRPEFVRRSKRSIREMKTGKRIPFEKIMSVYG